MYNFDDWYDRGVLLAQQLKKSISDFNEADHPRDESGRFTSKGEGEKESLKKYGKLKSTAIKTSISTIRQAKATLDTIKNKDIVNKETGIVAQVSSRGINKMLSNVAVEKSKVNGFSRTEHYSTASHIKELFEKARLIEIRADKHNDPNIKSIKRFFTPVILSDTQKGFALMTLKESIEHGDKIYSVELTKIIKPIDMQKAVAQFAQSVYNSFA